MDYILFCKNFFAATRIPVSLLKNGKAVYSAIGELLSMVPQTRYELFPLEQNPVFCRLSPDIEYGRVHIECTDYDIIAGPAFNVPVTDSMVRQYMRELMVSLDYREQLTECLSSIPRISHFQFASLLSFLFQCLNHREAVMQDFYTEQELYDRSRNQRQTEHIIDNIEHEHLHNSYYFELELYEQIKSGNVERLKKFLHTGSSLLNEGKMAHSPVRHTKNIFIATASRAGLLGAIPGGVGIEKTYQLVDYYVQECERLQNIEEITSLLYMMLLDFCGRCSETHMPDGISQEVYQCINYIRSHTNEPIGIDDVAKQVHRSSSYIMRHFKEELGIHIGAFITRCKLEEAKSLLTYSDKTLAEISSHLCFSSQSYFQNVFKKQYGITPMQYRKKTRTI